MTLRGRSTRRPPGARTGADGTPFAVDISADRRDRVVLATLVAGPVIWFLHFMLVYLVAEAGCTGDGRGLALFDSPVPTVVSIAATVAGAVACAVVAGIAHGRWRASSPPDGAVDVSGRGSLAFTGLLLALLAAVAIVFVGLPATALPEC
jgi:hypothetical protein